MVFGVVGGASKPKASSSGGGPGSVCFRRLASSSPYPVPSLTCPKHHRAFAGFINNRCAATTDQTAPPTPELAVGF
jgi:hypothetical protein